MRIFTLLFILVLSQLANATEFAVSPMLINVEGDPGTEQTFEIAVAGKENGKIRIAAYAMTQEISGHMSFTEAEFNPNHHPALQWIEFEKNTHNIRRGETTLVRGSVRVPRNTSGTHLAAIMVEEDPEASQSNIAIKVRYAVILNINIGSAPRRMTTQIGDFRVFEVEDRTLIEATFTNPNAFMGQVQSNVQIRDPNRRLVARIDLRTESAWQRGDAASRVYPGSVVKLYAELPNGFQSGDYSLLSRTLFNNKMQPIYRENIAYLSSRKPVNPADLKLFAEAAVPVSPRRSGISLTTVSLNNPTNEEISIRMPGNGSSIDSGIVSFEFIPKEFVLKPRMKRRVMLKQKHIPESAYKGEDFTVAAVLQGGIETTHVLKTIPATGEDS